MQKWVELKIFEHKTIENYYAQHIGLSQDKRRLLKKQKRLNTEKKQI